MIRSVKSLGLAAGLAVVLAACGPTMDPLSKRSELESITSSLGSETDNWPAYQAALAENADALAALAADCAQPSAADSDQLKAVCYSVSAEAYNLLTDLPSGAANLNGEPALLARSIAETAEPICTSLGDTAACRIVATVDSTVGARRFASDLVDMATNPSEADTETAQVLFDAFTSEVEDSWPASAGDANSTEFKLNQACYVSWAAGTLTAMSTGENAAALSQSARKAQRTAAIALALNPCDDGSESCARNQPCIDDPEGQTCGDRRTFALTRYCGPGVPTSGAGG